MGKATSVEKTNDKVIRLARDWIGTPYHHQASLKGVGCDCIGLVRGVYQEMYGVTPPTFNYSWDWGDANGNEDLVEAAFKYLEPVALEDMMPGDVIGIRWGKHRVVKHVMILTEADKAIHAYNRSDTTEIDLSRWWQDKIAMVFRFPEEI